MTQYIKDSDLATKIKKGDVLAFDEIYRRYSKRLYLFVFGIIKSKKDAEDVVQEVFVKIWENRSKIKQYLSFQSYLFTIAHNTTISLLRNKMKDDKFIENIKLLQYSEKGDSVQAEIEFNELNKKLQTSLNSLPERQRQVYLLSREEGLSYKQIAEKLEISINTVENQMVKALKFLRERLKDSTFTGMLFYFIFIESL